MTKNSHLVQALIETSSINLTTRGVSGGLYFDVSSRFENIYSARGSDRTGLDKKVRESILEIPGVMTEVEKISESVRSLVKGYANKRLKIARTRIVSQEGRHRSVVIAEEVARYLRTEGINAETNHLSL